MRVFTALVASYLALSLALGVAQQSHLWFRGQHATPQQWSAHDRFDRFGQADHHSHGTQPRDHTSLEHLFQTDASTAPPAAPLMPLDGTSCVLAVPLSAGGTDCAGPRLGTVRSLASPAPPLSPPRLPPRRG